MNQEIYFDNSATTKPSESCVDAITNCLTYNFGNPSSLHSKGFNAEKITNNSKEIIANSLKVNKNEIYFTSGGTEANNLCVFGGIDANKRKGKKIVTTAIEHSSVLQPIKHLEKLGFEVVYLKPNSNNTITLEQLVNSIDKNTIMVSMMYVNNETGVILPIDKVSKVIKSVNSPAIFHCDAVQAYGKIKIQPKKLNIDLLSLSAHKIHGSSGIGAIYKKSGINLNPIIYGGEQESKIRPGTQATALIGGFGACVNEIDYKVINHIKELKNYMVESLVNIEDIEINSPKDSLPYIVNFSVLGIKSETLLHYLASKNIYVSSGSACAKGKRSHVLSALGLPEKNINSAIRVSFSKHNTLEQVEYFITQIENATKEIIRKNK